MEGLKLHGKRQVNLCGLYKDLWLLDAEEGDRAEGELTPASLLRSPYWEHVTMH